MVSFSDQENAAVNSEKMLVFSCSVSPLVETEHITNDAEDRHRREALGKVAWLETFWLPTQKRRHPDHVLNIDQALFLVRAKCNSAENAAADKSPASSCGENCREFWNKTLQTALRKVHVEDLGDLAAQELWETIPVQDKEGRGRHDLEKLEKQLAVKVVFVCHDNHVLLVGAKAKLEKKCSVIRNLLSHYYWRLKGKQINL